MPAKHSESEVLEGTGSIEASKRKTRVSPWRNSGEFKQVYNWLYGEESNKETKRKAFQRITIWKLRRLDLTPAAVLSTLVILEIQLKDDYNISDKQEQSILRIMYSSAFTRFLNYMSSIMQKRNFKTMYETAKELGIESFLVDLRHLCAHGQSMPSLEVFRRTADYCIKWLKEFYWDHEEKHMENVDAKNIRCKDRTEFDENTNELFQIYDASIEAVIKGCSKVNNAKKVLQRPSYVLLKTFSNIHKEPDLDKILLLVLKVISASVRREAGLKDLPQIYNEAILRMEFFFQAAAYYTRSEEEVKKLIGLNQNLFQQAALFGFIEDLFYSLLTICGNEYECASRQKGASFWANQIVVGCVIFKNIKQLYKHEKEENPDIRIDLSTINTTNLARDIRKMYSKMNVDVDTLLIFGDTFRHPWSLSFSRAYIEDQLVQINEYTADIIKNCLSLVVPPLDEAQHTSLCEVIDVYLRNEQETDKNTTRKDNFQIRTLCKDVLCHDNCNDKMDLQEEENFGIWSSVSEDQEWYTCPLGRHTLEERRIG